ncbi:Rne/Rng family ribonuclease [bacterium]|nr:Rne/Rng family ribonuclease [bacterium]
MKKIIISTHPWQTRAAIMMDGKIQNIYFASHAIETLERVYIKGIVTKVLPGIQTAFVDIGQDRAGFLHISEIDRELALKKIGKNTEEISDAKLSTSSENKKREPKRHQSPDIAKIFKEGEAILVQVSKEPIYQKGAKLTTCFTLPGRFIVLMPNIPRIGVSKKVGDREERSRLKELVLKHLPEGMGAIIRTTSEGQQEKEIIRDIKYLVKTWNAIIKKFNQAEPKEQVHEDLPLALQVIRDHLDNDVDEIIIDNQDTQKKVYQFIKGIAPEHALKVKLHTAPPPLFEHLGIEKQIEDGLYKKVELKSGGSLIIETTEAMTVIDVNTGKFIGKKSMADTILKTNLEAAHEIVRQLRFRNIGGLIVIDFIDMLSQSHRQQLIRFFEKTLKERDKFQSVVLKVSEFGLVQMTRKRSGKTLTQQLTHNCPACKGSGFVKSIKTECYTVLRAIKKELLENKKLRDKLEIKINSAQLEHITNIEFNSILQLEKEFKSEITLSGLDSLAINRYKIKKK